MAQWPSPDDAAVYVPPPVEPPPSDADDERIRIATARVREGLPVTDYLLAALSPGEWLTPTEQEDDLRVQDRVDLARSVLADAGDLLTDITLCWHEGRRAVRVFLSGELDHYRQILVDALDSERVVVEQARLSRRERENLMERVRAEANELREAGIQLSRFGPRADGGVEIAYFAVDPDLARRTLTERLGPGLTLDYRGASRLWLRPQQFGSWLAEGTRLHVFYGLPRSGEQPAACTASESATEVIVDLTVLDSRGPKTGVGGFVPSQATVELDRELGDRVVIDNAANRARPHWTKVDRGPRPDLL